MTTTMPLPTYMKAIVCTGSKDASVTNVPLPSPPSGYALVKVHSVGLNPTDWKHIDYVARAGYNHIPGCDYSGTVVALGSGVDRFSIGDRIAGFIHGMKHEDPASGSFAEYAYAKANVQIKIPDGISFEEAATLGIGVITVGQSLFRSTGLPWPNQTISQRTSVLIYGASTATGMYAVQYAKLAGFRVIATCSEKNFTKVKGLGADAIFDYKDEQKCADSIREVTQNSLKYAMDCVSVESSARICANSLTTLAGAQYRTLLPMDNFPRSGVTVAETRAYDQFGDPYGYFFTSVTPAADEAEFAMEWWSMTEELLAQGNLRPIHPSVRPGGLNGVLGGLEDLKNDRVSGEKLVYRISETS